MRGVEKISHRATALSSCFPTPLVADHVLATVGQRRVMSMTCRLYKQIQPTLLNHAFYISQAWQFFAIFLTVNIAWKHKRTQRWFTAASGQCNTGKTGCCKAHLRLGKEILALTQQHAAQRWISCAIVLKPILIYSKCAPQSFAPAAWGASTTGMAPAAGAGGAARRPAPMSTGNSRGIRTLAMR